MREAVFKMQTVRGDKFMKTQKDVMRYQLARVKNIQLSSIMYYTVNFK